MPAGSPIPRRALAALIVAVGASLVVSMPAGAARRADPVASTTTTLDPTAALKQNQQQRSQLGGQIGSLKGSDAQNRNALAALDTKLAAANVALASASATAVQAQATLDAADLSEKAARVQADKTRQQVKKLAIDAYVNPDDQGLVEVLASKNPGDAQERQSILQIRAQRQDQILARRRSTVTALHKQHQAAQDAAAAATSAEAQQKQALSQIQAARNQQTQLVGSVEQQLNDALGEAAGLDATDSQLANQITQQQDQIEAAAKAQAAAEAAASTDVSTTTTPKTAKPGSKPTTATTTTTTTTPVHVVPPPLYTIADMQDVGGIYVNKIIASQVQGLLNAATAAGLTLTGGGYRDPQQQIQTRMNNCGTTDYAIYDEPASQCTPPTARPGTSMHEQGLAIDFDCSGTLIQTHTDPCWIWLSQNAATYGLYNLASEPWHWSVTGT